MAIPNLKLPSSLVIAVQESDLQASKGAGSWTRVTARAQHPTAAVGKHESVVEQRDPGLRGPEGCGEPWPQRQLRSTRL